MWETWVRSLGREDPLEKEMTTPLQYSCLKNPRNRGALQATVHGVTKSWTRLRNWHISSLFGKGGVHTNKNLSLQRFSASHKELMSP